MFELKQPFQFLYEDAPSPYQSLDNEGNILAVNTRWLEVLGYNEKEVVGEWFGGFLESKFQKKFQKKFSKFKEAGDIKDIEFRMLHKDGHLIPVAFHGKIAYDQNHSIVHTYCTFEDISSRYEVKHLNAVLKLIQDINRMIVREKESHKLLQQSCNILTSTNLYPYVWITTTYTEKWKFFSSLPPNNRLTTKEIESFHPQQLPCIEQLQSQKSDYIVIEPNAIYCQECSLKCGDYKKAYLFKFSHKNREYGNLMVSSTNRLALDELSLLQEVARDIAYGLFNIEREETLLKREERYRFVIEATSDGLWDWDLKRNALYLSPRWKEMIGYSDSQLQNEYNTWESKLHPADRPKTLKEVNRVIAHKEQYYKNRHRLRHKDGHWVWIEAKAQVHFDEEGNPVRMIGSHIDITEKQNYLIQLEKQKTELETIVKVAPYPIIIHDESGKIHMLNGAWSDYSGYSLEDFDTIHEGILLMFDKKTQELIKKKLPKLYKLKKNSNPGQYKVLTKSGKEGFWQFSSSPLGVVDGKKTIITSAVDITKLKEKDEMLIAQSRHAAMGEMIGMIAHQWRQPLSSISMDANNMLMDIAMGTMSMERAEYYAQSIANYTQHLSKTIDDFRNFFKPDKVLSRIQIKQSLKKTLSIVKESLKSNSIKLEIDYQSSEEIEAFPRELMQVFVNIITNAKDALVAHKPKEPIINISVFCDKKYLNIEICDNGGGITEDVLPKIFDPYFSTKDAKIGTGIGLYMSQMIVQKHLNGKIEVYNQDKGACFKVRLIRMAKDENR